jgi:hypothetical protein
MYWGNDKAWSTLIKDERRTRMNHLIRILMLGGAAADTQLQQDLSDRRF